ncbi:MAG: lysophospholipid acyltransferase family protein [Candidatus Aureabacteria bacterium]|nr:lysophospholipid acyltransferase family protein [Candidatus Auribacterota bacterium]
MHTLLTRIFGFVCGLFLRLACSTKRVTVTHGDVFDKYAEKGGNVFAFWHNRLFFHTYYYLRNCRSRKLSILVSMSRDGDYGTALALSLGFDVVRGSSSRGGQKAVKEIASRITGGNNVAITPDGPRGPAFRVNDGIIKIAQMTGARIIPVSYEASGKWVLKSWDKFILLRPFGRVHIAFGDPVNVPENMTSEMVEQYREKLEETLNGLDDICAGQLDTSA